MKPALSRQQLLSRKMRESDGSRACQAGEVQVQLAELAAWQLCSGALERNFAFGDFHDVMAFVNALAWMIHGENHHPDLVLGYNRCTVRWHTHSVNGISEKDFVCAARTDAIFGRNGG